MGCSGKGPELGRGQLSEDYEENRKFAIEDSLEGSQVASAIRKMLKHKKSEEGTATDFLKELEKYAPERDQKSRLWPKSANKLQGYCATRPHHSFRLGLTSFSGAKLHRAQENQNLARGFGRVINCPVNAPGCRSSGNLAMMECRSPFGLASLPQEGALASMASETGGIRRFRTV